LSTGGPQCDDRNLDELVEDDVSCGSTKLFGHKLVWVLVQAEWKLLDGMGVRVVLGDSRAVDEAATVGSVGGVNQTGDFYAH
jgi:hypothetical protein